MDVEMTRAKNKVLLYLGEQFDKVVFNEYRTQIIQSNGHSELYEVVYRHLGWSARSVLDSILYFECDDTIPVIVFPDKCYGVMQDNIEDKWVWFLIDSLKD